MFRIIVINFAHVLWRILGYIIPKNPEYIVLSTFPDYDDTFIAMQNAIEICNNKTLIVLTRHIHVPPLNVHDPRTIIVAAMSLRGIWYYHRSKTILFTHGLFSRWPPNDLQVVVNIWHGTPIKNIGLLDNKSPEEVAKSHYVLAESDDYKEIMASAFGIDPNRVLVGIHPRIDMLFGQKHSSVRKANPEKIIVAWLPTYRMSKTGDIRTDGSLEKDILSGKLDIEKLDRILVRHNAICVIKPHPMAVFRKDLFENSMRVILLDNADLVSEKLTVYEFLSGVDLLITDLSSVYFDFHLTGKPTLLYFPDRPEYESSRGFVRPLEAVFNKALIEDYDEFISELALALSRINDVGCVSPSQLICKETTSFANKFLSILDDL